MTRSESRARFLTAVLLTALVPALLFRCFPDRIARIRLNPSGTAYYISLITASVSVLFLLGFACLSFAMDNSRTAEMWKRRPLGNMYLSVFTGMAADGTAICCTAMYPYAAGNADPALRLVKAVIASQFAALVFFIWSASYVVSFMLRADEILPPH